MPDNTITLVGNVTRDPELRYTPSGQANLRLGMAVNRRWQNRQTNEWEEQVSFFNVVAWGDMGENAAASIGKGTRVIVAGRLEQRSYETDAGEKRSVVEVIADEIGPSLRWAQAQVQRNERTEGGTGGGGGGGASRPIQNEAPANGGGGGYGNDEEPF